MSAYNARLIEKDCFASIISTDAGSSAVIDLSGASKFSCQAIYDVQAPGAKTFNDGAAASKIIQDLTYTAAYFGTVGNAITVQYVGDGTAGAETVNVTGTAIVVHMDATAITGSTATQIATAIGLSAPALLLVSVAVSGTGATVQAVQSATHLATGVDSEVDIVASTLSISSHGFPVGLKIRLTTTGTLPAGLLTATDYFVIVVDASTIQLASTLANAIAGTAVAITDYGSDGGVGTVTAVSLSGASVTFKKSNDAVNWVDIQTATTITIDGSVIIEQPNVSYRYFKAVKALTAGVVDLKGLVLVIGDAV